MSFTDNYTSSGISVITPTGGRPLSFARCVQYLQRQTWRGPLQWIVIDDCLPRTAVPKVWEPPRSMATSVIHPEPAWQHGQNTLARNLLAAIPEVIFDRVVFIEDDDWYASDYLEHAASKLEGYPLFGEVPARYYYMPGRLYRVLSNRQHASLCQTALRRELLPRLEEICRAPSAEFIDVRLWQAPCPRQIDGESARCVGMKGLPGRAGIGIGHRPDWSNEWCKDADLSVLRAWVGEEDARLYYP